MSGSSPLKCKKCQKPIGYVTITAKSFLAATPPVDNIQLSGTCMIAQEKAAFTTETFMHPCPIREANDRNLHPKRR